MIDKSQTIIVGIPTKLLISQLLDALNDQTGFLIDAKTYSFYPVVQYAYDLILFYIYEFMNHLKLWKNRRKNRRVYVQNYLDQKVCELTI